MCTIHGFPAYEMNKVVGVAQEGRYQAKQYLACLSKDEFLANLLKEQGVNNALFARIAVALFKKDPQKCTPQQDQKLIAELEKMVDAYEAQTADHEK